VISWQDRYQASGIAADTTSRGLGAREINEIKVVVATLANDDRPPGRLRDYPLVGRFPTAELGISFASVARIWLNWHIRPRTGSSLQGGSDFIGRLKRMVDGLVPRSVVNHAANVNTWRGARFAVT
jgi:hypothetical protein